MIQQMVLLMINKETIMNNSVTAALEGQRVQTAESLVEELVPMNIRVCAISS